jgi:putative serine protease PepD
MTQRTTRFATVAAALAAAVVLGAGVGAGTYSVLSDDATTTVREVTVESSETGTESVAVSFANVYAGAHRGVVKITTTGVAAAPFGDQQQQTAQGSGFVYDDDGTVVTNQHVVEGADSISVRLWNGKSYRARLLGADPSTDLAVIDVDAPASVLHPLRLANSGALRVGDAVLALGSPFGLESTLTSGIVSALRRQMEAPNGFTINDSIQTDAAINHGNSGGPLLDTDGLVVGVNAQIKSESGGNDGVGFAIPSNTVRSVVTQLLQTGSVEHAYLGITMNETPDGIMVVEVRNGTPADDAGLEAATGSTTSVDGQSVPTGGDVIVAIDGAPVASPAELQSAIDAKRPGDEVTLTIVRDGERRAVEVTLTRRPATAPTG